MNQIPRIFLLVSQGLRVKYAPPVFRSTCQLIPGKHPGHRWLWHMQTVPDSVRTPTFCDTQRDDLLLQLLANLGWAAV